jgi:hypothetical protein
MAEKVCMFFTSTRCTVAVWSIQSHGNLAAEVFSHDTLDQGELFRAQIVHAAGFSSFETAVKRKICVRNNVLAGRKRSHASTVL